MLPSSERFGRLGEHPCVSLFALHTHPGAEGSSHAAVAGREGCTPASVSSQGSPPWGVTALGCPTAPTGL